MQITIDFDHHVDGSVAGRHFVETSDPAALNLLKGLHLATTPIAGTGWDVISKHPSYVNMTRLQVAIAEVIRLNDTATRSALGV